MNGLLDMDRATFCEYVELMEEEVRQLAETHNLPLKLQWSSNRGFCIQLTATNKNCPLDVKQLPEEFKRVVKTKAGIYFVTKEFTEKDSLVRDSLDEIGRMSNAVLNELLNEVREYIGFLYLLSETIATLDMISAFADVSMSEQWTRPQFGDSLVIRGGRHPILEHMTPDLTPNDTNVDQWSRLHILTGNHYYPVMREMLQISLIFITYYCVF